jgi:hypothetical protein
MIAGPETEVMGDSLLHIAMASARAAGLTSAGKAVGIAWSATGACPGLSSSAEAE